MTPRMNFPWKSLTVNHIRLREVWCVTTDVITLVGYLSITCELECIDHTMLLCCIDYLTTRFRRFYQYFTWIWWSHVTLTLTLIHGSIDLKLITSTFIKLNINPIIANFLLKNGVISVVRPELSTNLEPRTHLRIFQNYILMYVCNIGFSVVIFTYICIYLETISFSW